MIDSGTERLIGETMAELFRERLVELATVEESRAAPKDTNNRRAYLRILLARFGARAPVWPSRERGHGQHATQLKPLLSPKRRPGAIP